MDTLRKTALALIVAAAAAIALVPACASAAGHGKVVLFDEEQLAKTGAPTANFEGLEIAGDFCSETAIGKLIDNGRPVDRFAFTAVSERQCGEGRIVSGAVTALTVNRNGEVVETDSRTVELPGPCLYRLSRASVKFTLPALLLGRELSSTAKLVPGHSAAACTASLPAHIVIDPSDVETASIPYTAELG